MCLRPEARIVVAVPSKGRRQLSLPFAMEHFKQLHTSHIAHGGITLGRWTVLVNQKTLVNTCMQVIQGTSIRRRLRHVLDLTLKGICHSDKVKMTSGSRKRTHDQNDVYSGDDCVKPGYIDMDVITSCVKQPYEFIRRSLAPTELAQIYDLQSKVTDVLLQNGQSLTEHLNAISKSMPEKI